jgi:DtxR family transcriptional regulator, Mn-dependent transcriptional regulator
LAAKNPFSPSDHARHERDPTSSEAIEDYLKAIYALSRRSPGPVSNGALAERLGVTPATATSMVKRLDALGLVRRQPYKGVRLTAEGERAALGVIRHHRLLESYLSEALGMPWDRVHAEAEVLEHYISEELEALIADKLGNPSRDPHGDPIPGPDLSPPGEEGRPLVELEPGESATFSRVSDSDPAMLRYLEQRGITPGVLLSVVSRQPFGGPLLVSVGGREHALGGELVKRIVVSEASA